MIKYLHKFIYSPSYLRYEQEVKYSIIFIKLLRLILFFIPPILYVLPFWIKKLYKKKTIIKIKVKEIWGEYNNIKDYSKLADIHTERYKQKYRWDVLYNSIKKYGVVDKLRVRKLSKTDFLRDYQNRKFFEDNNDNPDIYKYVVTNGNHRIRILRELDLEKVIEVILVKN